MNMIDKIAMNRLKKTIYKNQSSVKSEDNTISIDDINQLFNQTRYHGENLSEVTYFTCIKILSETMGKLSIELKQDTKEGTVKVTDHEAYRMLSQRPNPYMSPSTFKSLVEFNRNHYGNAFIWARYKGAHIADLWVLENDYVTILVDNVNLLATEDKLYYQYINPKNGQSYIFNQKEIIHLKSGTSKNGLQGLSVQEILSTTMQGNKASQSFLNNLNEKGMTARATLEYTGDLDRSKRAELIKTIEEYALGQENAGRIVPIPLGMKLTPLDMKLTDSQYFELRKYSALQIAAAFGIKPNHLNNYEKSSYSNSESQNLSFYVDTLLFILKQWEEELDYKLLTEDERNKGMHFKFNVASILRGDLKTQAECLSKYVNNGIYTPNEARDMLDFTTQEGGDVLIVNGNYIPVTQVGNQYQKGGD